MNFKPVGKFNIGVTAGTEGCMSRSLDRINNKMQITIVPSEFTKKIF